MSTSGGPNGDGSHPCDGWGIQEYEIERLRLLSEGAKKDAAICELWVLADTSELEPEMALYVGGIVAEEMERDHARVSTRQKPG